MGNDAVSLYILIESLKYKQSRKKLRMVLVFCYHISADFKKLSHSIPWKCTRHISRELKHAMICQTGTRTFWSWASFSDILGVTFCFHLTPPGQSETMVVS